MAVCRKAMQADIQNQQKVTGNKKIQVAHSSLKRKEGNEKRKAISGAATGNSYIPVMTLSLCDLNEANTKQNPIGGVD